MDALIFPLNQDMSFPEVFLATYRFFVGSQTLLGCLIGWYNADADNTKKPGSEEFLGKHKDAIQARTIRVMISWIRNHWIDFNNNSGLESELDVFVDYVSNFSFGASQKLIQAIGDQKLAWFTNRYIAVFIPTKIETAEDTLPLLEWDYEVFAHNLAAIDHLLFRRISPDVYLKILEKPAVVSGGMSSTPLNILCSFNEWFRTVIQMLTNRLSAIQRLLFLDKQRIRCALLKLKDL